MSNNTKPTRELKSQGLIPKLRFPEFRDAPEWEAKHMMDVAPLQRGFDLPSDKVKLGRIPVVYSNGVQRFHSMGMAKGPGLVTGRSGTIGKIHFIEEGDYWPHNTSLWVTSFKGNFPKFIYYLYKSIGIKRFASGSGVPTLNRNYIHAFQTRLPPSAEEQQKIADCLSSIDELITAQAQKIDALKTHKKGLMQQMFPAEGETLPKLRFPEFRDAGEWEEKRLGEVVSVLQGFGFPEKYQGKKDGKYPFYKVSDISNAIASGNYFIKKSANYIDDSDLLDLRAKTIPNGTTIFAKIGEAIRSNRRAITTKESMIDNNTAGIKSKKGKADDQFVFYLFSRVNLIDHAGGVVPSVNKTTMENIGIVCPQLPEQQKIADGLSSIDELIAAQAQKLDALKTHKKGLMQQLFPSAEEVGG